MEPAPLVLAPLVLPAAPEGVPVGFPSPAQDYWAGGLDLADQLIRDGACTYIWRAAGHSMTDAGIHDQDLLLVHRGIDARHGHIVVAIVDGEYTVKRLDLSGIGPVLRAECPWPLRHRPARADGDERLGRGDLGAPPDRPVDVRRGR